MKKFCILALLATTFCLSEPLPGAAADKEGAGKKIAAIPIRTAGCIWALMVGTPIAITRASVMRYQNHMDDVADMEGTNNGGVWYAAPLGFGEGLAHGLYIGPRNALANFDKPFSKESVSLGELYPKTAP